ncbi:hypothetical protein HDF16_000225 [Granulicella aggregans]|uniref:Uncharacterized protein n=1 Tax=Granulicella aggregans TaxID=474949 RepID=A0A7W7ZA42_9BACT|nr:hypothetical protein [Granulicella aggregans]MBB5055556.1 hypothetical protein [Granulicella aggregans]
MKVLIAVKTYPTISEKYTELACTAGFREDGSWIRLYPIPFRLLDEEQQYKKYQWVEVDIARNKGDQRPESHRVLKTSGIKLLDEVGTERQWADRRKLVLGNQKIYTNLKEIIDQAHDNKISLAVFRPSAVLEFVAEAAEPEWPRDKITGILNGLKQGHLFEDQNLDDFRIMPKLPYKFSYRFKDDAGVESKLMIEDWEIGQLYWNCEKLYGKNQAVQKVRQKYMDDFVKTKDLYLFLGTTYEWHVRKARNPFVIIGTFHPPHMTQESLF